MSAHPVPLRHSNIWITSIVCFYLGFRVSFCSSKLLAIWIQAHLASSYVNKLITSLYSFNLKRKKKNIVWQISCPLLVLLLVERMDSSVFSHPELFFINWNHCLFSTPSLCCDTHSTAALYAVQMGLLSDELGNVQWMLEVIPHKRKGSTPKFAPMRQTELD